MSPAAAMTGSAAAAAAGATTRPSDGESATSASNPADARPRLTMSASRRDLRRRGREGGDRGGVLTTPGARRAGAGRTTSRVQPPGGPAAQDKAHAQRGDFQAAQSVCLPDSPNDHPAARYLNRSPRSPPIGPGCRARMGAGTRHHPAPRRHEPMQRVAAVAPWQHPAQQSIRHREARTCSPARGSHSRSGATTLRPTCSRRQTGPRDGGAGGAHGPASAWRHLRRGRTRVPTGSAG
jgi:hypothetical protein